MAKTAEEMVMPSASMACPVLELALRSIVGSKSWLVPRPRVMAGLLLRVPRAPAVFSKVTLGLVVFTVGATVRRWRLEGVVSSSGSGSSWMVSRPVVVEAQLPD